MRGDGSVVHVIRLLQRLPDSGCRAPALLAYYVDVTQRNARFAGLAELGQYALEEPRSVELDHRARALVAGLLGLEEEQAAAALGGNPEVVELLPIDDQGFVRAVVNVLESASAKSRAESDRRQMAMHDALTGLPNRSLLAEKLDEAVCMLIPGREYLCLLMLDLDGFKRVNDSLGHGRGDALLRDVAQRLTGAVRPSDVVARFGGDEFAILLTGLTIPDEAELVAQRLLDALKVPFSASGRAVHLSASIGIATARSRSVSAGTLMADADLAMYEAKTSGKGRFVAFSPSFRKAAAGRLSLEEDLRAAVEAGSFRLDFQPILDLTSMRWVGAEALLRWPHPTRGLVPPLDFIPLAEDTGLVAPLGRWVLEKALEHRVSWAPLVEQQESFGIAVNVSVRQLVEPGFVDHVRATVEAAALPASAITIEMTESVFMDDSASNVRVLKELHDLGVRLAIDDFGTGYSALSYLRKFPIDILKLDRSFVAGLQHATEDCAVTRAVIDIAHHLNLELVAEGIETAEQLELLRQFGCRLGQGYFLFRPMPADAIVEKYPAG